VIFGVPIFIGLCVGFIWVKCWCYIGVLLVPWHSKPPVFSFLERWGTGVPQAVFCAGYFDFRGKFLIVVELVRS
jgi:hypothetical protein